MACHGCSGAVERALKKVEGVSAVETNLTTQTVHVTGTASKETVLQAITKTGKKVIPL